MWRLNQEISSLSAGLAQLDKHVNYQLASLPGKISTAAADIVSSRRKSNARLINVAAGIAIGRILREAGANLNDETITVGDVLDTAGASVSSAAYAGARAVQVQG